MFTWDARSLSRCLIVGAVGLALSACGGGGSSPSSGTPPTGGAPNTPEVPPPPPIPPAPIPPAPTTSTISGVAAVGAPLTGTVTVKDAAGVTKTVAIGTNGSYAIDVTGMTAPFVFRAEGIANGRAYIVHSAAAAADVNGAINITQLTDLVVSNIAGQIASNYFDSGNFGSLNKTALDAEAGKLKEKLLPVLQALGVDASIDLLRTQFTPLSSALDSALDILRVSVDSQSNVATITNIVTQQQIQDDLAVAAAAEASPAQLSDTSGVTTGVSDVTAIKSALTTFSAKFATGLPSAATVQASFTSTFRFDDMDGATFAAELAADSSMVGSKFTDVDITKIDYTDLTRVVATVDFTAKDKDGFEMDRLRDFKLVKDSNDTWQLHGNRHVMEITGDAHMMRIGSGDGVECRITGLEFDIEDFDSGNNGGAIDHFIVSGPGLPQGGLRYNEPALGGLWRIAGQDFPFYSMASSCQPSQAVTDAAIAAIPDGAQYRFVAYSSVDNSAKLNLPGGLPDGSYTVTIEKRPLTLAEVKATDDFPVISAPTSAALANYSGGDLAISVSGVNPGSYVDVFAQLDTAGNAFQEADAYLPPASDGKLDLTLTLLEPAQNDSITWRQLAVSSLDAYRRSMMTIYNHGTR